MIKFIILLIYLNHLQNSSILLPLAPDEYASNMQQRSNKAIHDRDESNYALKQALVEVEKYKSHLKIAESLIGTEKTKKNKNKSLITPISVGMTTILAIVLFGRRFN